MNPLKMQFQYDCLMGICMETQELLYMIATIMVNQTNIIICFLYIKMKLYVIRSQVIVHCVVDGIILTTPSTYLTVRKISSGRLVRNFTKMGEWSVRSQVADTGDRNVRLDDHSSFGKLGSNGFQGHEVTTVLHRRRVEATGLDLRVEYTVGKKKIIIIHKTLTIFCLVFGRKTTLG